MSVTFVAGVAANDGQSSSTSTAAFTVPSSATAHVADTAIVVLQTNSGTATFTPPSGWTALSGSSPDNTSNNNVTQVYVKDLVSGDLGASASFTVSSTPTRFIGSMLIFRGTTAASLTIAYASRSTASTSITSPTITTSGANTEIVEVWCAHTASTSAATITVPGVDTAASTTKTGFAASPNKTIQSGYLTTTGAAGTYGGNTATASLSSTANVYTLALPAATTTGSGTISPSGGGTTAFSSPAVIAQATSGLSGGGTTTLTSPAKAASDTLALAGGGVVSLGVAGGLGVSGSGGLTFSGIGVTLADSLFLGGDSSLMVTEVFPTTIFKGVLAQRIVPLSGALAALMNYSRAVLRINGQWVETEFPTEEQIDAADLYFPGGYETVVDHTTATLLQAAGYTVDSE